MPQFDEDDDVLWEEEEQTEEEEDADDELDNLIAEVDELADTGQLRRAVRIWRRSIDRFSDEPRAYHHYGLTCFRLLEFETSYQPNWDTEPSLVGLYEEAAGALEEAVGLEEENYEAWNILGALYALRENYREAVQAWERSLSTEPDQPQVVEDLESVRHKLGKGRK